MSRLVFLLCLVVTCDLGAIDFQTDIVAVLTKAGCNSGACHGAAVGRGEFRLSLYGGDPDADFRSIVRELQGRRVNLAHPELSLLLLKPTESVEHGGGQRLDAVGEGAARIRQWIQEGARWSNQIQAGAETSRRLQHLSVSPQTLIAPSLGAEISLMATAHFSDGSHQDVTRWTVFMAEDPGAIEVDDSNSVATVRRPGRHIIIARYLSEVAPIEILVPLTHQLVKQESGDDMGLIDRHVSRRLQMLRIPSSPAADDAIFVRRIYLDLTGRLPNAHQLRTFTARDAADRRQDLIDELLESDAFNEYWTMQLASLLRIRFRAHGAQAATTYHRWLQQQLADHIGYDSLVRELLTAEGDRFDYGPANFYRTVAGPREQAELTSEVFMGNRLRCANCHNHPLDHWTQDDYHGLAAIFAKVRADRNVSLDQRGVVFHPKTGEPAVPRIPGSGTMESGQDSPHDPRVALSQWLTDASNPYFAKAIVNRLWKSLMGRGLVEPVDDLRATNPATHPELLQALADDFVAHDYDLRHTLRLIAQSEAYARDSASIDGNEADDRFYSHSLRKPLSPEVLADAISDVLELSEAYGDHPIGTRAVSLIDPGTESPSLDILGRCDRDEGCEATSGASTAGLPLKLHLFNGKLLNARLGSPGSRLARLLKAEHPPGEIIAEFYLVALQRPPQPPESHYWSEQLRHQLGASAAIPNRAEHQQASEFLEDFVWSLLTCDEFTTNH